MPDPYLQDADVTIYQGNALDVLRELPDESVHMCCTSPPFYGLRDYGTGSWEGGDPDCDHKQSATGGNPTQGPNKGNNNAEAAPYRDTCGKCGAIRVDQQIGLEPTPDEWAAALVDVFREVRRVLRRDGTCWIEIGDSYNATRTRASFGDQGQNEQGAHGMARPLVPGCKPKDLIGAPWLLAFALRADGWYLRSEIIWAKPNPMPESVTDRPTVSHSRVFLLAKEARYFYDGEAIREPHNHDGRSVTSVQGAGGSIQHRNGERWPERPQMKRARDLFEQAGLTDAHLQAIRAIGMNDAGKAQVNQSGYGKNDPEMQRLADEAKAALGGYFREFLIPAGRNRRSVWTIPTEPYPEAHFATWPTKLVEPMILAGTSERGVCPECGAPWERIIERRPNPAGISGGEHREPGRPGGLVNGRPRDYEAEAAIGGAQTVGWHPTCACYGGEPHGPTVPATVLDPFGGSGTTAHVARKHGRRSILIELNQAYCELAADRLAQQSLLA